MLTDLSSSDFLRTFKNQYRYLHLKSRDCWALEEISYSYSVFHFICQVDYAIHAAKALKPFLLAASLFYELYYKASLVIESDFSTEWNLEQLFLL